ncbi:UDP-N-acetylmuramoyl-tripeptide--D-alanyl-D-alanine ligase [Xylanibacter ruminicola]|jgi:UDP-N-acetylmuramoyl-tripeptide--D-alanyl-D-alanine ligase|uniref:UDP-N-acetylmuramoyl-tripeptide--D-alanyl-D-alanine ligase n=2 Tax=Bacteroidales TaxID=171549 RepID=A0A1H5XMM3_XYLRU|nr:UDP-N-acetylmuramoyl-tripeptide--D-alanyl-D-alanine ligase [Xylanibacter ruminicola]SEV93775.1 UDP-N-acetylmuramoyl-tripeptide--D-alanyl-D-alanine ligase [Prevotella sp. khp7]
MPSEELRFFIIFAAKFTKFMEIKELYKLYQQHPCITTDSRDCPQGSIFLALKGELFDGNKFAASAIEKGCAYAIVDDASVVPASDNRFIVVQDCLQTFKDLAREHRRQFNIPVIGITGTNGKTTTKELIAAVLSQKYNVLYTQGNFNNDVGVPKTLFRLSNEHEIAVIEMGASHPGDIKTLAETAEPTCGLITNVGKAHLQGFGSFEGVIKTKCELYDFLRKQKDSLIFINADNEHLVDQISDDEELWLSPYSTDPDNQYSCISGEIISCDPFLKFRWREPLMVLEEEGRSTKWHKVQTQLIGSYNIDNLLAAIAVGINFGVDRKKICAALEEYTPSNNRSQMTITEKNHLIVDAYNANPSSMQAALENFKLMQADNKMAILGAMRELGEVSAEEHQRIVDYLKTTDVKTVWLVGEEFKDIKCDYHKFNDVEEVKAAIKAQCPEGQYILIKGSNSTKLFQLPELL